jgi:hypothetical protein
MPEPPPVTIATRFGRFTLKGLRAVS